MSNDQTTPLDPVLFSITDRWPNGDEFVIKLSDSGALEALCAKAKTARFGTVSVGNGALVVECVTSDGKSRSEPKPVTQRRRKRDKDQKVSDA